MSTAQVKLLKSVDTLPKSVTMAPDDHEFWIAMRHSLLMQLATIEKKLGMVSRRCRHCNSRNVEVAG